jgi:hypothetical protein
MSNDLWDSKPEKKKRHNLLSHPKAIEKKKATQDDSSATAFKILG